MDVWKNRKSLYLKPPAKFHEEIVNFENNPFLIKCNSEQLVYEFPLQQCISLQHLIFALEHKFIQIFRGQALLIVRMIIWHYVNMHGQKLNHDNLSSSNIWIHLGGPLRFSIYARKQEFLKIYFVDYKGENYCEKKECKNLGLALNEFLAIFFKDSHQEWKQFYNGISGCELNGDYLNVIAQINDFLDRNIDQKKQILKNNFDYKEVGYTSNRYRQEMLIKSIFEDILTYDQTQVVGGEQNILFINLYQYLLQIITDYRMKEIIKDFGKALETNYLGVAAKDIEDCQHRINPISKQFLKIVENKLFNKEQLEKGVQQMKEFIQLFNTENEKTFKFAIKITKYPEQILFDSWVDWIQSNLVDNPTNLLNKEIETLKDSIHSNSQQTYVKLYISQFQIESQKLVRELL